MSATGESADTEPSPPRRRGIYLLPNLFTTATLFGGFYAIVASLRGEFVPAAMAIFAAMVADTRHAAGARHAASAKKPATSVSIDVNTGRFTGKGKKDPDQTILKTNLDAAREVAKQLRLRDIGGIIVVDFIDMESKEHREMLVHEMRTQLGRDRARTKAYDVSALGLIEMTRQRVRPSLFQSLTSICGSCGGTGRIYTPATVVRRIERSLTRVASAKDEKLIVVRVHPEVALRVMEEEPGLLKRLRGSTRLQLALRDDPRMRVDEFRLLAGPAETDVTDKYVAA